MGRREGEGERELAWSSGVEALFQGSAEETSAHLRAVLEAVPTFVVYLDKDLRVVAMNRIPPPARIEELRGRPILSLIPPEDREAAADCFEQVFNTGTIGTYRARAPMPDGPSLTYDNYVAPIRAGDEITGLCIATVDETAKLELHSEIHEKRGDLELAIEATGIGMWHMDLRTDQVEWSDRFCEITGRKAPLRSEEFRNKIVHPDDRPLFDESNRQLIETGRFGPSIHRILRPGGEVRWVLISGKVFEDEQGHPIRMTGGMFDLTKEREAEQQLQRAQRMQAIGNLSTGVAHNFNNMLMVIMPTMELLRPHLPASQHALLDDAYETAKRAASMVNQLMTFTGQRRSKERSETEIGQVVSAALRRIDQEQHCGAAVHTHVTTHSPVMCDRSELQHVFVNILQNCCDAFERANTEGPRIDIFIEQVDPDWVGQVNGTESLSGPMLRVRIRDNGPGMSDATCAQVFDPFFSTSPMVGTGLGLATAYRIVLDHDGWIDVKSREGEGSEFSVLLPALPLRTGHDSDQEPLAQERRVLLLIDDMPLIHNVVRHYVEPQYELLCASSGREARAILEDRKDIALALLDRSIPGEEGDSLVPVLREAIPTLSILYFTGENVPPDEAAAVQGVLEKPVDRPHLLATLKKALAKG